MVELLSDDPLGARPFSSGRWSVALAVGLIAGLYPAWRASRMQPVEALRYE